MLPSYMKCCIHSFIYVHFRVEFYVKEIRKYYWCYQYRDYMNSAICCTTNIFYGISIFIQIHGEKL